MLLQERLPILFFSALLAFVAIQPLSASVLRSRATPAQGFFDPLSNGGAMLTVVFNTFPAGLGEPLNTIISAQSDPAVLVDQQANGGLRNYFLSFGFASECLGQHLGDHQQANLGDGNGDLNETAVIRYDYGDPALGTCKETVDGGNHFRYWVQNGPQASSGAIFMAVSYEQPIAQGHNIVFDGYNLGRDWLVGNITGSPIPTSSLTNTSTFNGTTTFGNFTYSTGIEYVSGLLQNSSVGVNHFASVGGGPNNITAVDGLVAVLTVKITGRPPASSSGAWKLTPYQSALTYAFILLFAFFGLDLA